MADERLPGIISHLRCAVGRRDTPGVSDAQLLQRFAEQHDEAAFELLVWRHARMVLGTCRRLLRDAHEAEDAFQACFLALARRAGSISRRESVGGWLHQVARRLALAARARQGRRTALEQTLGSRLSERVPGGPAWEAEQLEARLLLDEEVERLPERFRVPFVLCCLEGRSHAEVARELGCPPGTLESRLTRARQRLCQRLSRRGLTLPAGLLAGLLTEGYVSATLVACTARAATLSSARLAAAVGLISPQAATLTEGVLRAMLLTKLKAAGAVLLALTLAGVAAGALGYHAADGPPSEQKATKDGARIDRLIEQLGSDEFAEREKASRQLAELGVAAHDALRKAARSTDAERRKRANDLLKKIEGQVARAEVLRPKRLRLLYKQTPLAEAIADFNKKSGYDLALSDPQGKLKGRTVTLDTGLVTFWQALGQFCDKANLVEVTASPAPAGGGAGGMGMPGMPGMPGRPGGALPKMAPPGGGAGLPKAPAPPPVAPAAAGRPGMGGGLGGPAGWFSSGSSAQILLADGKPGRLPTDDTTAIRHRILKIADVVGKAREGEILLALEVALEPKLRWQQLVGVKVGKATDDRGQQLEQMAPAAGGAPLGAVRPPLPAPGPGGGGAGGMAPPRAVPGMPGRGGFEAPRGRNSDSRSHLAAIRLKKPAKASTTLQELSGTVTARVLGEALPLLRVPDVLEAAGKTVKGTAGGSIRVLAVNKERDGRGSLRLEVELPGGPVAVIAGGGDRVLLEDFHAADSRQNELSLVDRDGNRVRPLTLRLLSKGPRNFELHLSYLVGAGQPAPSKLVLSESKSVRVDLPFTLKNVPLP